MPVLDSDMSSHFDVDNLVMDLSERLCLKTNQDRSFHRVISVSPYQNSRRHHVNCHGANSNHHSKMNNSDYFLHGRKENSHRRQRRSKLSKIKHKVSDDSRALLDKLLKDQSLIQEAVRRVQFQFELKDDVHHVDRNLVSDLLRDDSDSKECSSFASSTYGSKDL